MIAPDLETAIDQLQELVDGARVIVPFTGAGISTECGIPDFRSPGRALDQEPADPVRRVPGQPGDARTKPGGGVSPWRSSSPRRVPGRGHLALASFYRAGKAPAVITQNIDNLHQSLGNCRGTRGRAARQQYLRAMPRLRASATNCRGCRQQFTDAHGRAPDCPDCGGHIKTATSRSGRRCRSGRCAAPSN